MQEQEKIAAINEIYHSIQGESTWAGRPCVFVRLTFCDLRCNYCDTEYAFYEGKSKRCRTSSMQWRRFVVRWSKSRRRAFIAEKRTALMSMLCDGGYTVLLETAARMIFQKLIPASIGSWI